MSKSVEEYLRHILQEASYLISQSRDLAVAEFLDDETRLRAFASR